MRLICAAACATCMAFAGPVLAHERVGELQLSPRAGFGQLAIDQFEGNEELEDVDTYGAGVALGFATPIGVLVEVGAENYGMFDWFDAIDEFRLDQRYVALGYQFELGEGWRLTPKVGRSRWKLTSEEGELFNPGPEETSVLRGYEYFWELGFGKRVTEHMTLGMSVRSGDYEFGGADSVAFVMTFGW